MPRYAIETEDGETLGVHDSSTPTWNVGDRIPMPPGLPLVVVTAPETPENEPPRLVVHRS